MTEETYLLLNTKFHKDLLTLKDKLKDISFAIDMYRALCNMRWKDKSNSKNIYSCSWRFAGGLIAEIRDIGEDYLNFYCSGNEGFVSNEINDILNELGWEQCPWK